MDSQIETEFLYTLCYIHTVPGMYIMKGNICCVIQNNITKGSVSEQSCFGICRCHTVETDIPIVYTSTADRHVVNLGYYLVHSSGACVLELSVSQ